MMKRTTCLLAAMLMLGGLAASAAGWQEERDEAARLKKEAEARPRAVPAPEVAMNVHILDDKVAADLKRAGVKTVRQTVYWYNVEKTKTPGVYDEAALKKLDERFALYKKYDLEPLLMVHGNAPGASFANREESYKRFGDFMAMLAKRYPDIRYLQLWNEMDVAFTDLFGARGKEKLPMAERGRCYAEMLKIVSPMIRAANPDVKIVTGVMTDWDEFPRAVYSNGGREHFDILAVHTYGVPLSWSFIRRGVTLRRTMDELGDAAKPLWNTEFGISGEGIVKAWGIPKGDDPVAALNESQKKHIQDCIEFNDKARIFDKAFIYVYHGKSEASKAVKEKLLAAAPNANLDDLSFSLVRSDGTVRPAMQYLFDRQAAGQKKK